MKTEWNYSDLAEAYLKRADYADDVIASIVSLAQLQKGDAVADIGAGVAHLTLKLHEAGLSVHAVEPNDEMRKWGSKRCEAFDSVVWSEGTGEETGLPDHAFKLATFGSSFNVVDRDRALEECLRILEPQSWFACMWNHRDLEDPIQMEIEAVISSAIPGYDYGSRRESQEDYLRQSGKFSEIHTLEGRILHTQKIEDVVEAWRSHATLHRQAGDKFDAIVNDIEALLRAKNTDDIIVPYVTRAWAARFN